MTVGRIPNIEGGIQPTLLTTTGDIMYASSASNPARLGIGSSAQVLTVASGVPSWATPASGGMTLISTTTLTGASVSLSSIPQTYNNLQLIIKNYLPASDNEFLSIRFNNDSTANRHRTVTSDQVNDGQSGNWTFNSTLTTTGANDSVVAQGLIAVTFFDYTNTTTWKFANSMGITNDATTTTSVEVNNKTLIYNQINAITSLTLLPESGNFTSGTALLYGVK